MVVTNIDWNVTEEDVLDMLNNMSSSWAADVLEISAIEYIEMDEDERKKLAAKKLEENRWRIFQYMDLPLDVEIPDDVAETEAEAADELCDEYGFGVVSLKVEQ